MCIFNRNRNKYGKWLGLSFINDYHTGDLTSRDKMYCASWLHNYKNTWIAKCNFKQGLKYAWQPKLSGSSSSSSSTVLRNNSTFGEYFVGLINKQKAQIESMKTSEELLNIREKVEDLYDMYDLHVEKTSITRNKNTKTKTKKLKNKKSVANVNKNTINVNNRHSKSNVSIFSNLNGHCYNCLNCYNRSSTRWSMSNGRVVLKRNVRSFRSH